MKSCLLDEVTAWAKTISQDEQMRQGWLLVDVDSSGVLEIQRYDEDPEERFESDDEALDFVIDLIFPQGEPA